MASYIDLNDLGSFASIEALWAAYPEGGQEGDYCTIDGVKYRWDKYDRMWVADPNFGPTPARNVDTFYSDVNMQNNLTVAGYIRAKGIKQPCVGLFASLAALEAKWPEPEVGMWALVGDSISIDTPADVYRCDTDGTWAATGGTAYLDGLEFNVDKAVTGWVPISSTSQLPTDPTPDQQGRGYLLGTMLYVYVGTGGDTLSGKYQSAQLKGLKGDKGDKGDNAIVLPGTYSAYIADNLETDDPEKILSAKQGKRLYDVQKTVKRVVSTGTYDKDSQDFWTQGKLYNFTAPFEVGKAATLQNEASSFYSIPVAVSVGDVISFKGCGVGCAAVTLNADGTNPRCLLKHEAVSTPTQLDDVVVSADGYVAFSRYSTYTCEIVITKTEGEFPDVARQVLLNTAYIEGQKKENLFPKQRMYPLFWNRVDSYNDGSQRKASRNNLMTDWVEIPDGASVVNITCESGDGSSLSSLWPQIYFVDEDYESTSSTTSITFGTDRAIPAGSKYYRLRFGYNTGNTTYHALLPSYMQKKFILYAPMTQEQYDKKFMQSYEDGRQQLHSYDWDGLKLTTACMAGYGSVSRKDFQLAIITDSHGDALYADNFFHSANDHLTVDAIVHCGDWQPSTYNQKASRMEFIEMFSKSTKPVYVAIGNHDHGYNYVSMSASQKMLYNDIVVPMVENGWLEEGEYIEDKCYYYHDFTDAKVRLIVLNDYDNDDLAENVYWEPVTYDPNAPAFLYNHTYTYDASNPTIVNCGEYNEFSFKLKKSVTTEGSGDPYMRRSTIPCMAVDWQSRIFSEEQAQWLADTLLSTPANFKVVIASHMPFSRNVTMQDRKFCQYNDFKDYGMDTWYYEHIATDFLAAVVDAFQRGVAFSHKVVMQGLADYLNTETDSQGNHYAYEVTANFANKNNGATFMCFIGGHCHGDIVWRHNTYTQWGVYPMATKPQYGSICDILDAAYPDYPNLAHWTAVAFGKTYVSGDATIDKRIGLARVGKDLTKDLTRRDIEFIDTSE